VFPYKFVTNRENPRMTCFLIVWLTQTILEKIDSGLLGSGRRIEMTKLDGYGKVPS